MKKRASDRGIDKFLAKILGFFWVLIFSTDFRLVFFFIFGSFHEEFFKVFFSGFWDFFRILGHFLKDFLKYCQQFFELFTPRFWGFFQDLEIFWDLGIFIKILGYFWGFWYSLWDFWTLFVISGTFYGILGLFGGF